MDARHSIVHILYFAELAASESPTIKMGHMSSIGIIKMILLHLAQKTLSLVLPNPVKLKIRTNHYTLNRTLDFTNKVIESCLNTWSPLNSTVWEDSLE